MFSLALKKFQVPESFYLRHKLTHFRFEDHCHHCKEEKVLGLEPLATRVEPSSRPIQQRKSVEFDVFAEAIDYAIEYKQV